MTTKMIGFKYPLNIEEYINTADVLLAWVIRRFIVSVATGGYYIYIITKCYAIINTAQHFLDLASWGRRKESLVTTACTCANPYQQNMASCFCFFFSLEIDIVIGWRWCPEDFNKVTQTYVDSWFFDWAFYCASAAFELGWHSIHCHSIFFVIICIYS